MPGMPGTGLGGVFYALLILWIALRELWLSARRASGGARWLKIGEFAGLLLGIIAAFWLMGWGIKRLAASALGFAPFAAAFTAEHKAIDALIPVVALLPFVILAVLLGGVHLLRLAVSCERLPLADMPPVAAVVPGEAESVG